MIIQTIVKVITGSWIIYTILFLVYMVKEYLANAEGYWNVLPDICCNPEQKYPIYMHIIGATIITIFGPIQLLNFLPIKNWIHMHIDDDCCTRYLFKINSILLLNRKIHPYTGLIYLNGFILAAGGGLTFIWYNGTVAGPWMTIPFVIYGLLMIAFPVITVIFAVIGSKRIHYYWAIRTFALGNGSIFYRTLYKITCHIFIKCGIVTFTDPMDYAFDWLFFIVPLALAEIYIFLVSRNII